MFEIWSDGNLVENNCFKNGISHGIFTYDNTHYSSSQYYYTWSIIFSVYVIINNNGF